MFGSAHGVVDRRRPRPEPQAAASNPTTKPPGLQICSTSALMINLEVPSRAAAADAYFVKVICETMIESYITLGSLKILVSALRLLSW